MNPNPPNRGAVASLAETVAQLISSVAEAAPDSTGQAMVKVRKALIARLQRDLAAVYPDARDHNRTVTNALQRDLA
jgi:hypothetical protein